MTPAVERALERAQHWARHDRSEKVEPRHLLWALLEEEQGRAAILLKQHGTDLSDVCPEPVSNHTAIEPTDTLPMGELARNVMSEARGLAWQISLEQSVSSECLLLAVLREDVAVRKQLQGANLDYDKLESTIAGQVGVPVELEEPLSLDASVEQMSVARIVDANANRAREALRVVEDYCRFALDDHFLTEELKRLRHGLTEALSAIPASQLLEARETQQDVGTVISTASEHERFSLHEVAQVNWKRLQEALRSLEEHGKLHAAEMGRAIEQLRYRSYTLERAMLLGAAARERLAECRIQVLVTGASCKRGIDRTICEAIVGGADLIQLREKDLPDRELIQRARDVRRWTRDADVLFVMNDRPDVARLVEADGVHLGQDDLPVKEARRLVGRDALIGVSTHDLGQLRRAILDGASYVGVGPAFPSATKSFADLAGLDYVRAAIAETTLPAFVIGGVNVTTLPAAVEAGAQRIAVSEVVCAAEEPRAVVRELFRLLADSWCAVKTKNGGWDIEA